MFKYGKKLCITLEYNTTKKLDIGREKMTDSKMISTEEKPERVILFGVQQDKGVDMEVSLDELAELVDTAGAITVGRLIQNRDAIHSGTYLGKGKIEELRDMCQALEADGVVCDDELSPAQIKNLEAVIGKKIMDRTMVILDIFAAHANTSEGKIQVELAQLQYRASKLSGLGRQLSRLGGGIGTRGPGEKKLEIDRRRIHDRISQLKSELEEIKAHREVNRAKRQKTRIPVIAIVGYTNAGKSTLLNAMTDAGILAYDKLFATLDPTTREYELESGRNVLLTDTVGFISKLPHNLINAFRSTLEEAAYADLIFHVVDASDPNMKDQMRVVYKTLDELGVKGKPVYTIFNKCDKLTDDVKLSDDRADIIIKISAKEGTNLDKVSLAIEDFVNEGSELIEKVFAYNEAGKIQIIRDVGQLISEEYEADGIHVKAYMPKGYSI